jgi:hypothetical protein
LSDVRHHDNRPAQRGFPARIPTSLRRKEELSFLVIQEQQGGSWPLEIISIEVSAA